MRLIFTSITVLALTACGDGSTYETFGGKFSSVRTCLELTQSHANSRISFLATDTPSEVTGKLSNGAHFGCVMRVTGTEGTFVEGWYTVAKTK